MRNMRLRASWLGITGLICIASALFVTGCAGKEKPVVNMDAAGVAIRGYDPVAYFTVGQPAQGNPKFEYQWMGATWRFAGQDHLQLFAAAPAKYAPQYGGYCAYAVSRGKTADIDPEAWSIVNGKLYLNLNEDVRKLWSRDSDENIRQADANWPAVLAR